MEVGRAPGEERAEGREAHHTAGCAAGRQRALHGPPCRGPRVPCWLEPLASKAALPTAAHLMVMPRSCSSARVSVRRWSPACSMAMIPAAATSESVRVDLPAQRGWGGDS